MRNLNFLALFAFLFMFAACESDPEFTPATSYECGSYAANASTQLTVRQQLSDLVSAMQVGRTSGALLDKDLLISLYETGNPALADIAAASYDAQATTWLEQMGVAAGGTWTPGDTDNTTGGVFGGYLFDENGLELEQMVEKGFFGAGLYNHFLTLTKDEVSLTDIDAMVAIFGAHPMFQNSDNKDLHQHPDVFAAKYAARRDQNDGNGLYTQMRDAFIVLQSAVGDTENDWSIERDEAIADLKSTWEKSNAATVINYCQSAITKLSTTNPTAADQASALHAYGEGVGFLRGFHGITANDKIITDDQIEQLLIKMNAPLNGTPSSYLFVTDAVNELPKLQDVIVELQTIYGFSDAEIESFRSNWVNEQGR